jgi:hypothetical protein
MVVRVKSILLKMKIIDGAVLALLMVGQVIVTLVNTSNKSKLKTDGIKR